MDAADVVAAVAVLACGAAAAALAVFVWTRRQGTAGTSLAVLLSALAVWNLAYGAELLAPDPAWRLRLGDLKYVGIGALTPAWLSFILSWTGRGARVTRRLLTLLAVEPLLLLLVLAVPATHDLVRYLPPDAPDPLSAEVATGPLFWVHLVYTDALLLPATAVFVASLLRRSRAYWLQAAALSAAALVPWVANLLFTLSVGPFGRVDLTPVAFTASGAVLAWGLFQQRLLRLNPLARSLLVDRMLDGVVVLDAYGRVTDANPAARQVLGGAGPLPGRRAADVLPPEVVGGGATGLPLGGRFYDVSDVALPGGPRSPAGRMLVLRDVTEREALERRLRTLLAEQHRVAGQLSSSLRPAALPVVPGLGLAGRFRPAGAGREIGGDFYDVVRVDGEWAFALGDVSGKGARAAATTAQARYTLRTLALAGDQPSTALRRLHALLAGELDDETYLTVVHGRVRVTPAGLCVRLALGGHPQPVVVRACGHTEPVGVPGSAIGLFDDVDVVETDLLLGAGDALVLFTDGVSESRTGGTMYGDGGLTATLARAAVGSASAGQLADAVLAGALSLAGGEAPDDIAVLVLQAAPGAVPPAPRCAAAGRARRCAPVRTPDGARGAACARARGAAPTPRGGLPLRTVRASPAYRPASPTQRRAKPPAQRPYVGEARLPYATSPRTPREAPLRRGSPPPLRNVTPNPPRSALTKGKPASPTQRHPEPPAQSPYEGEARLPYATSPPAPRTAHLRRGSPRSRHPSPAPATQTVASAGTVTTPPATRAPGAVDTSSVPSPTGTCTSSPRVLSTTTSPPARTSASTPSGAGTSRTSRPSRGSSSRRRASNRRYAPSTAGSRSTALAAASGPNGSQGSPAVKPSPAARESHGIGVRQPSRPATVCPLRRQIGSWRRPGGTSVSSSPSSSPW